LFVVLGLISAENLAAQEARRPTADNISPILFSPAPYTAGERLTYNVSFATFPSAAHIELTVANRTTVGTREVIELRAHVETLGVVNAALYAVNNDYRTSVNPLTGVPFRTQITTRDGARSDDLEREYNQPVGANAIPARTTRVSVGGSYDLLSAVYRARALPLAVGSAYRFQISAGRSASETYDVELRVTGRETRKTSVGSFNTIVAVARTRSKSNEYLTRINFTDDERHVPVFVSVQLAAGEIRAELASASLPAAPPAAQPEPNIAVTPTPNKPEASIPRNVPAEPTTPNAASSATPSVGEQLNYNVFLGASAQAVGTVACEVRGRGRFFEREALLVNATARTSGVGERLFPVNDRITSYLDPLTLLPFRSEMQLQEGARRLSRIWSFEQERGEAVRADGLRTEILNGTYDLPSLIYAVRRFDLAPPKRTSIAIMTANRPHTLTITSVGREQIQLGGEQIAAVQLRLTTDDREPDRHGLRVWISDDRRRLPLRFTMQTPLGAVRADLAIIPVVSQ
jgi:hypothetical protein